jgi:SNF2 family DNA or RNA helicase
MDLRPYQHEGASFLADTTKAKGRLLGDEPGLGKTRQAIAACDTLQARRVLVLCPAVAKSHWQREFQTLQTLKRQIQVLNQQRDTIDPKRPQGMPLVVIVNYDLIHGPEQPLRRKLLAQAWDALVLDEAHALKNPDAKRTRFIYGKRLDGAAPSLVSQCQHVFVLTGTPMPNHSGELWTHLHALTPSLIPDPLRPEHPLTYERFCDRYAVIQNTPWGNKVVGSKNLPDLNKRLQPFMLRRRKVDVLKDLPPLTFELYALTLDAPPPSDPVLDQLSDQDLESLLAAPAAISTARRMLGEAKALPAVALALSELESDPKSKLIIFCHHISVLDLMAQAFFGKVKIARIDGRTSPKDRDLAIEAFQRNPDTRIFLGQIQAAGVAITLTASSNVLIVEPSFVPAQNVQAASRAHRFGQKNSVLVRYLFCPGTLDERIIKILHRKTRDIAVVTNDDTVNLGMPA